MARPWRSTQVRPWTCRELGAESGRVHVDGNPGARAPHNTRPCKTPAQVSRQQGGRCHPDHPVDRQRRRYAMPAMERQQPLTPWQGTFAFIVPAPPRSNAQEMRGANGLAPSRAPDCAGAQRCAASPCLRSPVRARSGVADMSRPRNPRACAVPAPGSPAHRRHHRRRPAAGLPRRPRRPRAERRR
jgi:hypothetical protein